MNTRYITLGTFVLVTLGAFAWLAAQLGFRPDGSRYTVRMADAAGLVEGNAVRIAGVEIGKIESIHVEGEQAVVQIKIKRGNVLYANVCAASLMKGMLGEKFLGLRHDKQADPDPAPLKDGAEITCVDRTVDVGSALNSTAGMIYGETELLAPVARLVTRLDSLTANLEGEGLPEREQLGAILKDAAGTLHLAHEILAENRQPLHEIATTGSKLLRNPKIPRMIDDLELVSDQLARRVPDMLDRLDRAVDRLEKASGVLDERRVARIGEIIDDASASLKNLRSISNDFKGVGKDVAPMLKDLGTIAHRATYLTGSLIRQVLQQEGFRVRIGKIRRSKDDAWEAE
jgi:phospholipid/cholesterol/gamma-HCH transport system substrate-binding protein